MNTSDLCDYIDHKFYVPIQHQLITALKYLDNCNLDNEHNPEICSLIRILLNKLNIESNKIIKNDKLILFPRLIREDYAVSIQVINKSHQLIINLLHKIRELFNNYIQQPSWNIYTKLASLECLSLEESLQSMIYIKENFLWQKLNKEEFVS